MSDVTKPRARVGTTAGMLACGVAAGPIYVVVGLVQLLIRDGFDISRHPLSVMSNGDLGWIQIANFLLAGGLTVVGAVGLRRALRPGKAATWGPLLVGIYGAAVFLNGLFRADPVDGFPPGTPLGPPTTISWHGSVHFLVGALGFFALIAGTFVIARRFKAEQQNGWAIYSRTTGAVFAAGFLALPISGNNPAAAVFFALTVVVAWAWVSAVTGKLRSQQT
ncbi:DUF998 domain-containing protein [Tenggerimyces flavus]|uniref:DUF998 domain-containing protein n=1 Tax=Tenggerimyces flavus TaxID=1708749 RepID=A0ABV7YNG3_9ACTN|nr:DUF998 domain-containing protein [Tenggerimyces flavus]MBM7785764.1 ABC-type Na+ efflux pump permease subunit [Tenggerimyces flavus]